MANTYSDVTGGQLELSWAPPQNFFIAIERLPGLQFTVQQVNVPPVSGGEAPMPTRFNSGRAFIPGDTVDYAQLDATFLIDKNFKTYQAILKWVKGINNPEGGTQFDDFIDDQTSLGPKFGKTMSNITLFGTDASNQPVAEWKFFNAFPISIDGPQFDSTRLDMEYMTASASFRYMYLEFTTYTNGAKNNDTI